LDAAAVRSEGSYAFVFVVVKKAAAPERRETQEAAEADDRDGVVDVRSRSVGPIR
jgi:hypothetical protein